MSNKNSDNFKNQEALIERVKELECLYDITAIVTQHTGSFKKLMTAISKRIGKAWKHSSDALAEITVGATSFSHRKIPTNTVKIKEIILVDGEIVGMLYVHYPAEKYSINDFLPEEYQLLKVLAKEIAVIIERKKRIENEESLKRIVERHDRLSILGEITAGIAHELNTPLGNILGFSEFILQNSKTDKILNDAKKIHVSALHAREVVKKLMFFSCEIPQQMKSVALNPLVEDAIELLGPTIKNAGLKVEFNPDPKNSFGRMDPVQYTQVVFNLVINAINTSPKRSVIKISLSTDDRFSRLTIEDYGEGIPDEVQDRIFEPFFTTKAVGKGTGLGLSMVHGIVKSHKGNIKFSSAVGKGTTFVVSIPLIE